MAKRKRKAKKAKVNKLVVFCGVVIMTLAVLITLADKITLPFYVPTWDELSSMVNPQAQLDEEGRTHLEVHAIDVGQGDSIYIKAGSKNILIDAGENDQGPTVSKYLRELGVDRLDLVVGTHPHSDHIGGLDYIIEQFKVSSVLLPSLPGKHYAHHQNLFGYAGSHCRKGCESAQGRGGLEL